MTMHNKIKSGIAAIALVAASTGAATALEPFDSLGIDVGNHAMTAVNAVLTGLTASQKDAVEDACETIIAVRRGYDNATIAFCDVVFYSQGINPYLEETVSANDAESAYEDNDAEPTDDNDALDS